MGRSLEDRESAGRETDLFSSRETRDLRRRGGGVVLELSILERRALGELNDHHGRLLSPFEDLLEEFINVSLP